MRTSATIAVGTALIASSITIAACPVAAVTYTGTASANSPFSLALFNAESQRHPEGNLTISGYSIAEAFNLVRLGAAGNTATQLDVALLGGQGTYDPKNRKSLRLTLTDAAVAKKSGTSLGVSNSIWLNKGTAVLDTFKAAAKENFAATAETVDLNSATAPRTINAWVANNTKGMIPKLLDDRATKGSSSVIVNAIAFKGLWSVPFAEPKLAPFAIGGKEKRVPTLTGKATVTTTTSANIVTLEYTGGFQMNISLPDTSDEKGLRAAMAELHAGIAPSTCTGVQTSFPVWATHSSVDDLIPILKDMGVIDVFTNKANLSKLATTPQFVAKIVHQAAVTVDAKGTKAAAATAVIMAPTAMPPGPEAANPCPKSFAVNRGFVYTISHVISGEIVFAGRILDPTA
jgi:serpin B